MTNKERWADWVLIVAGVHTYLGKMLDPHVVPEEEKRYGNNYLILCPCIEIIEEHPIVPGKDNQPVIMPVKSFATIGMFASDNMPIVVWASMCCNLDNASEEQLQSYTDAYDQMLKHVENMREASRHHKAAIRLPTADDIARHGKGGPGDQSQ